MEKEEQSVYLYIEHIQIGLITVGKCLETFVVNCIDDIDDNKSVLTCLQAAVKVKDDHQETAQTQGKNQPHDLCFSHAESWGWGGVGWGGPGEPDRLRLETNCCSFYFITDKWIDPTR